MHPDTSADVTLLLPYYQVELIIAMNQNLPLYATIYLPIYRAINRGISHDISADISHDIATDMCRQLPDISADISYMYDLSLYSSWR